VCRVLFRSWAHDTTMSDYCPTHRPAALDAERERVEFQDWLNQHRERLVEQMREERKKEVDIREAARKEWSNSAAGQAHLSALAGMQSGQCGNGQQFQSSMYAGMAGLCP
jgi:hypothetical protein